MRIFQVLGLAIFMTMAAVAHANSVSELSWLQGSWVGGFQGGTYETYFSSPGAGVVLGIARQIDSSASSLLFFEFTTIQETANGIVICPMPFGQPGSAKLVAAEVKPGRLVFTNSEDKFPQRIIYELNESGQLVVTVSGTKNNQPVLFQIVQNRISK